MRAYCAHFFSAVHSVTSHRQPQEGVDRPWQSANLTNKGFFPRELLLNIYQHSTIFGIDFKITLPKKNDLLLINSRNKSEYMFNNKIIVGTTLKTRKWLFDLYFCIYFPFQFPFKVFPFLGVYFEGFFRWLNFLLPAKSVLLMA